MASSVMDMLVHGKLPWNLDVVSVDELTEEAT
jgi:hypothetical protein